MSITDSTLAARIAGKLGIDQVAAESILSTYIGQIEELEQRTIDTDAIGDDDAEFLIGAASSAQRAGDLAHHELADFEDAQAEYERLAGAADLARLERNAKLRAARSAGARPADFIRPGLSRSMVEQITSGAR